VFCLRFGFLLLLLGAPALARDYFVAPRGDNTADGLTPATALKTFAAVAPRLRPGDVLRLQRGGVWTETLRLTVNGEPKRPIRITAYGSGDPPTIDAAGTLDICIDASASFMSIDSLRVTHASATNRGAITVWAHNDIAGLSIEGCEIVDNAGRGIWIAGEEGRQVGWVFIHDNTISRNAGCGVLATKLNVGWIVDNNLAGNCGKTVDPWQAAIRVWSSDVRQLYIANNQIDNGLHGLEKGSGMGIHVDETADGVCVVDNDIRHCDASGIEIENTRGVMVSDNVIADVDTGVFVYRAGHDHRIEHNTVLTRSLGIVLQGWLAHGVDAGPEIRVDGQLLTNNTVTANIAIADRWAGLKLVGGGEQLDGPHANLVSNNALGPERPELVELGDRHLDTYSGSPALKIEKKFTILPPFGNLDAGDLHLPSDWAGFGARHFKR